MCKLRSTVITTIFKINGYSLPCMPERYVWTHSDIYHLYISTSRDKVGILSLRQPNNSQLKDERRWISWEISTAEALSKTKTPRVDAHGMEVWWTPGFSLQNHPPAGLLGIHCQTGSCWKLGRNHRAIAAFLINSLATNQYESSKKTGRCLELFDQKLTDWIKLHF